MKMDNALLFRAGVYEEGLGVSIRDALIIVHFVSGL
jgi:hypothetical protein